MRAQSYATLPLIVTAAAVLVWVVLSIPGPVFFNVDGGTKFLGVRYMAEHGYGHGFASPESAWAAQLWQGDAFPFRPPFAVPHAQGWRMGFPLPFIATSRPGFALLGWRGVYLVPMLATVGTLCAFAWRLRAHSQQLALVALALGSFSTIYGAMFWEHSSALFLCLLGTFSWTKAAQPDTEGRPRTAALLGALLGAAGFFRPEAWVLGACVVLARGLTRWAPRQELLAYLGGFVAMGLAFAAHNYLVYGALLGAHAQQLGASVDLAAGSTGMGYGEVLSGLLFELCSNSPSAWLAAFALLLAGTQRRNAALAAPALAFFLFVVLVPTILPNAGGRQWGPRYLIVALPLLWTLVASFDGATGRGAEAPPPSRIGFTKVLYLAAAAGLAYNLAYAASTVRKVYQRDVQRLVKALEVSDVEVVAIAVPLQAGELAGQLERWPYFLAPESLSLVRVAAAMPPELSSLAWIVPAPGGPEGSTFHLEGPRPLDCRFEGWALAAHFIVHCTVRPASAQSTGE